MKRREAKALGLKRYSTGKPCKHGHLSDRFTSTGGCVECLAVHNISASQKAVKQAYRERNREKERQTWRSRYETSREAESQRKRRYYEQNKGAVLARTATWASRNKPKRAAASARRRAQQKRATPPWLTTEHLKQIEHIYESCPPGHHVDHIVPLQSKVVCGLHVPWNLQYLTGDANRRKFNRLTAEEQPTEEARTGL